MRRIGSGIGVLLSAMGLAGGIGVALSRTSLGQEPPPDPLDALGITVTGGAAPGYLPDRVCAICHNEIYSSYQEVGMAKSFFRQRPERDIEDFENNHFFHQPSQRHYEMVRRGDRLIFRRWQVDGKGEPIQVFERDVDWVLGSGHHSRVYLFRTEAGELYQLPVAWYSQSGRWGMAPGYDRPRHLGVTRRVRRECMFCHNGYPDVPAGSDSHGAAQVFPAELPEGTGCQRCHGPGAEHARRAFAGGKLDREALRAAIVNPGRLAPRLRDSICFGCHLQPSVALPGVRRFGRPDYSFRPGEPLSDYLVPMDVDEEGRSRAERFEINHHPYRLAQSRCYQESEGALSCLTCHDPHRKVPEAERAAHYRSACLGCHRLDDCRLPSMAQEARAAMPDADPRDCVSCHMPKRRTQDVVQVVMTDHRIRREAGGPELLAPIQESDPLLVGVEPLWPDRAPQGDLGEIYRAVAVLRVGASAEAVDHLGSKLKAVSPSDATPLYDLVRGQLQQHRWAAAEATARTFLHDSPGDPLALEWLGIAAASQGRGEEAIALLRQSLEASSERPGGWFNLGRLLVGYGRAREAVGALERAVALRPTLAPAWFHLGNARAELEEPELAVEAYRRALAIEPSLTEAYLRLAPVLVAVGQRGQALRYLRHGAVVANPPEPVARMLEELEAGETRR